MAFLKVTTACAAARSMGAASTSTTRIGASPGNREIGIWSKSNSVSRHPSRVSG